MELWEEHLKDPLAVLDKALNYAKVITKVDSWPFESTTTITSNRMVSNLMLPLWEEVLWPFLDAWD